jgi:hypothetical protein
MSDERDRDQQPRARDAGSEAAAAPSDEKMYTGEELDTGHGTYRPQQQNAPGKDNIAGSGEWPDPDAPAQPPAPGAVE